MYGNCEGIISVTLCHSWVTLYNYLADKFFYESKERIIPPHSDVGDLSVSECWDCVS